jgi:hypothetical protein
VPEAPYNQCEAPYNQSDTRECQPSKKEVELGKLQADIGRRVEEKISGRVVTHSRVSLPGVRFFTWTILLGVIN